MADAYRPTGRGAVVPYLLVSHATLLIEFLQRAFGGVELRRLEGPDGTITHAEILIDGSIVMVGSRKQVVQNSTHLYVRDVDETYRRCLELGADSISKPATFPYGDRSAGIRDPFGNVWWIGTHLDPAHDASA